MGLIPQPPPQRERLLAIAHAEVEKYFDELRSRLAQR